MSDSYTKAYDYLESIAKDRHESFYEIVEDSYEYDNGLLLIVYSDSKHENEKYHICIDIDEKGE